MNGLATILADMLLSALTWEQSHGQPPPGGNEGALTATHPGVYTDTARNQGGGKHDDNNNSFQKAEPDDDLRGPERT